MPEHVRDKLAQFQNLQEQIQNLVMQKQQMIYSKSDIDKAIVELKKTKEGEIVYRLSGTVLIKKDGDVVKKELEDQSEIIDSRIRSMAKQEETLKKHLESMSSELKQMLGQG